VRGKGAARDSVRTRRRLVPPVRDRSRYLKSLCGIACLAAGLALSGYVGQMPTQAAGDASLTARINAEFQAVKVHAAQVQVELPRLDQALPGYSFEWPLMNSSFVSST
jgi:hypothetical protein